MTEQKPTWNFDVTRLSHRDLNACLFFLEHERLPAADEMSDEPEDLATYGTGSEVHLIELAALYAHGVLIPPPEVMIQIGVIDGGGGKLPDTVDPGVYDGMNAKEYPGINLDETFLDYHLAELAPILIKYPFTA